MSDGTSHARSLIGQTVACLNCGAEQRLEFSLCAVCGCRLLPAQPRDAPTRGQGLRRLRATPSISIVPGNPPPRAVTPPATLADGLVFDDEPAAPLALVNKIGPDPLIGFVVAGRYRIMERIGRGGMGVVYKVEHTELGKLLAMKLLTGELGNEPQVVRRFKREALLASRLSHPNTVQVFDFGSSDGLTYLVMELVHGHDLAWILAHEGPMRYERAAKILLQVCSSLAEAHGLGIIHRDMKPGNIMVSRAPDGEEVAKVLDFGLAKLREAPEVNEMTGGGAVVGTPLYMSPEQIMGRPVDGRTDIYALGAVMYRALTTEPPFKNSAPVSVLARHLNEDPQAPHERKPDLGIPVQASEIVLRALKKKPSDRYQRVEEMQAELLALLADSSESRGESLLNPSRLNMLHAAILKTAAYEDTQPVDPVLGGPLPKMAIATRDEVEAFKRKLTRQKWVGIGTAVLVAATAAGIGWRAWVRTTAAPTFNGSETEVNNQSSQANDVPFGIPVTGQIGKRIDTERSDRDFYRIVIPAGSSLISIRTTALPNMATCTMLYRSGDEGVSARFCPGRAGAELTVPAYRVEPGTWLFAVMQDRERYGMPESPGVVENVSDSYTLLVEPSSAPPGWEVEPNDQPRAASLVALGRPVRGDLAWARDEDVVCVEAQEAAQQVRWIVRDAENRVRARGAVLEVTALSGLKDFVSIRVHGPHSGEGRFGLEDAASPWRSGAIQAGATSEAACLRLRLVSDPWAGPDAPAFPPSGDEAWEVGIERVE